ncbi:MAG TPA: STAS domain-containing protein [Bryobacteraceae bacterium]|nr:STAS domain-containing protein [Bryobacteraceae bacterium]
MQRLNIEVRGGAHPGHEIMVLQGVLNIDTAFQFRDAVRNHAPETLILDMTAVRYVDSSGLGAIIGTYVSFERDCRHLLLAGTNDRVWDIFRICKVTDVFTRYATVDDAELYSVSAPTSESDPPGSETSGGTDLPHAAVCDEPSQSSEDRSLHSEPGPAEASDIAAHDTARS